MTCVRCESVGVVVEPGAVRCRMCGHIAYDRLRHQAQQDFERRSGMVAPPALASQRHSATRRYNTPSNDASS